MSAASSPSEPHSPVACGGHPAETATPVRRTASEAAAALALAPVRATGGVALRVAARDGRTHIAHLEERGGFRLKFPTVEGDRLEAVLLNTGGGIAGGDSLAVRVEVAAGADAVLATQAAERIYRALGPSARATLRLEVGCGARLDWLPQETLLFSGARLARRFDVAVVPSGRLTMVEMVTFGRLASGETMGEGLLHDVWRVRRGGRLVFAEGLRLDGDLARLLARPAVARGSRAAALLLHVAPDAGDRLDAVRAALAAAGGDCGASSWNGMLVARVLAADPADMRRAVRMGLTAITRRPLPRVWGA